jgi:SM-20-related protein
MSAAPGPLQKIPPHLTIGDVMPPALHAEMLDWAIANRELMDDARIGGGQYAPNFRRALTLSLRRSESAPWKAAASAEIEARLPRLFEALKIPPFAHRIEAALVAYTNGCFVRTHVDTAYGDAREPTDRVLTAVYYFHREPKAFAGGELRLYPLGAPGSGPRPFAELVPAQNSLVAFGSWAPHEVMPVSVPSERWEDSRFAVNFWVRKLTS